MIKKFVSKVKVWLCFREVYDENKTFYFILRSPLLNYSLACNHDFIRVGYSTSKIVNLHNNYSERVLHIIRRDEGLLYIMLITKYF